MNRYCKCGFRVIVERVFNGLAWVIELHDPRTGYPVYRCPRCGEYWYGAEDLLDDPPEEDDDQISTKGM